MVLLPLWTALALGVAASPALRIEPAGDPRQVQVTAVLPANLLPKLPAGKLTQDQGETWLRLCLVDEAAKEGPAMLGAYERRQDKLLFRPRFPLLPGQRYRATFAAGPGKAVVVEYRAPARPPGPPTVVAAVYPSTDVLPANHLRFAIHFSQPMRGGKTIFDNIQLLDADGKEVEDPWLRDELWDEKDQRLLLYIHPGRIKWGLLLRMLLGPVLEPDREYTLVIGPGVLDADGRPLGKEFRKKFRTTAENLRRVELADWKVQTPAAGSLRPLQLTFPKPIDRVSLQKFLTVVDAGGAAVAGRVEVGRHERSWLFHPERPWRNDRYSVQVDGRLEDPSGNSPVRAFDTDRTAAAPAPQALTLPFRPMPETR